MGTDIQPHAMALLAWSGLLLLSWYGLGSAVWRWATGSGRADVGLCTGTGLCVTALLGGPLNAMRACSAATVVGLILFGAALAVRPAWRGVRRMARRPRRFACAALPLLPVVALGALNVGAALTTHGIDANLIDDYAFYMTMPLRMLQTGAALEPLNSRRLSTFGGHAFLQAQTFVVGGVETAYLVDMGLASGVVVMLLIGLRRRRGWGRWAACVLAAGCWLYPVARVNCTATWTVTAAFLVMLRAVRSAERRPVRRLRLLVLAGLAATAACTLRDNLLAVPPVFFGLYFADRLLRAPRQWRAVAVEAGVVAAVGVVALLPWSAALYQACGSFLYPLWKGNNRDPFYAFVLPGTPLSTRLSLAMQTLLAEPFVFAYIPLIFVILRKDRTTAYLYAAMLVMSAATVFEFTTAEQYWYFRFCIPALLAPAFVGLDAAVRVPAAGSRMPWALACGAAAVVGVGTWTAGDPLVNLYTRAAELRASLLPLHGSMLPGLRTEYAAMQRAIPAGARVASILDFPTELNFARNPIDCVDLPGSATRVGFWPFGQGPEALAQFLSAQGVEDVAYFDFHRAIGIYRYDLWASNVGRIRGAERFVDMMRTVEALRAVRSVIYDHDGYCVIRLR